MRNDFSSDVVVLHHYSSMFCCIRHLVLFVFFFQITSSFPVTGLQLCFCIRWPLITLTSHIWHCLGLSCSLSLASFSTESIDLWKIYLPRHVSKKIGSSTLYLSWFKIVSFVQVFPWQSTYMLKNDEHPGGVHDGLFNIYTGHKSLNWYWTFWILFSKLLQASGISSKNCVQCVCVKKIIIINLCED